MLYIPVGPPACGKSTLADQMVASGILDADAIVSSDRLRVLLTGDVNCQTANYEVFSIAHKIAATRLKYNQDVYLDATNLVAKDIKKILDLAPSLDDVEIIISDTSHELCTERNNRRSRTVPQEAMEKFYARQNNFDLISLLAEYPIGTILLSAKLAEVKDTVFPQIFPPDEPVESRETPVKAPRILNSFVPAWLPLEPPFDA